MNSGWLKNRKQLDGEVAMPDLIAQGPAPTDRWRRTLPKTEGAGNVIILGRTAVGWSVPWDDRISRNHAKLIWNGKRLEISRLIDSRNPIFYRGLRKDEFDIGIGEHFVIGLTTFSLVDQRIRVMSQSDEPPALTELSYAPALLRQTRYRDADRRIDVLSRLPEIISGSSTDEELCVRVVNVLMQGIPQAALVALIADTRSLPTAPASTGGSESGVSLRSRDANFDSASRHFGELTEAGVRLLHWDAEHPRSPVLSISAIDRASDSNQAKHVAHLEPLCGSAWGILFARCQLYSERERRLGVLHPNPQRSMPGLGDLCCGGLYYTASPQTVAGCYGSL